MSSSFLSLAIPSILVTHLEERGITEPTAIQEQAIPVIATGKDLIAESQTGTGKTLAYLLPVMTGIDVNRKEVQVVILVPTRELGMQIVREAEKLAVELGTSVQQLIGGAALSRQIEKLRTHPNLVVGTPGRVLELINKRKLSLHSVKTIIVDEVDQVFDLGSKKDVELILAKAMRDRQILFFSATITASIREMADKWMKDPEEIRIEPQKKAADTLQHLYFVTEERNKIDMLRRIVRQYNPKTAIVFLNDTEDIAEIAAKIKYTGLSIKALYGDSGKLARAHVMKGFREGSFQLLLATDIAARGLDFPGLTHVINFDLPIDADHYVHRAGRTGRMGQAGTVISLLVEKERFIINKFSKTLHIPFVDQTLFGGEVLAPGEARRGSERGAAAAKGASVERSESSHKGAGEAAGASSERGTAAAKGGASVERSESSRKGASEAAGASNERGTAAARGASVERGESSRKGTRDVAGASSERAASASGVVAERKPRTVDRQTVTPGGKPAAATRPKSQRERERERKAKGAPKWLKAKQQDNKGDI
ncbi:MAG: DEAD/DEAH box helicase [Gorillibacterium sp.]|nr:DEAD/DEAH box helicase [Gorillibacterium sp.]